MKKAYAIIIPVLAAFFLALHFSSCEKFILPEIEISPDTLFFSPLADSANVTVKANVSWQASVQGDATWVSISSGAGEMEGTLKVKVAPSDQETRKATVSIKSETLNKNLVVIQRKEQDGAQEKQD